MCPRLGEETCIRNLKQKLLEFLHVKACDREEEESRCGVENLACTALM